MKILLTVPSHFALFLFSTVALSWLDSSINVRLPPSLNLPPNPNWIAAPNAFFYGTWSATYSSQPYYTYLYNIQADLDPTFNLTVPGQRISLTSFQLPNDTKIETAYGIETPTYSVSQRHSMPYAYDNAYTFVGSGYLNATNMEEVLAWGYDTDGFEYQVVYETATAQDGAPPDIDIESRSDMGPTEETLQEIKSALCGLNNSMITDLVGQLYKLTQNGARRDTIPAIYTCGKACQENLGDKPTRRRRWCDDSCRKL